MGSEKAHMKVETWHIPGVVNIPVGRIRTSLGRIPVGKPIYTYCKLGFPEVYSLSGGVMTFCGYHCAGICGGEPQPLLLSYAEEPAATKAESAGRTAWADCAGTRRPGI